MRKQRKTYTPEEKVGIIRKHLLEIVASPDSDRLQFLLDEYSRRFAEDFLAMMPPLEKGI